MDMNNTATIRQSVARVELVNAFLRTVYNWMAVGLGITAVIACALTYTDLRYYMLTPTAQTIGLVCIFAELALVFILSLRIQKLQASTATTMFMVYSALNGITLSYVLMAYAASTVATAFLTTTGMFAAMSIYGLTTKRDLTSMGSLLTMALFGLIIAMVVNIFLASSTMDWIISIAGVLIFLGLTAYDTQFLKEMGESVPQNDATAVRRGAIIGALKLYLDFINIFIMLLRIFGGNRE